jgi:putative chitinase
MRAQEFIVENTDNTAADAWIKKVYDMYPQTWQNNHVMPLGGEGEDQQFAMFELVPSLSKRGAVEVKWFQAYPLRQGVGSRAMAELQRLAREDGIALTLYAWDKGQVSRPKLMKFYKQAGFNSKNKSPVMSWEPELDEVSDELLQRYHGRAEQQVSRRQGHMDRAREHLSKSYEIYRAEEPTNIVHSFEAGTPALAQKYYQDYINNYDSDVDYDLRLRKATGIVDEDWRNWVAGIGTAAMLAGGGGAAYDAYKAKQAQQPQATQAAQQSQQAQQVDPKKIQQAQALLAKKPAKLLYHTAVANGLQGTELAQFMAQCAHETADFSTLKEFGGKLDFKKYEIKHNPAKAKELGNLRPGDGLKYFGRGYLQITGKYNYQKASKALGLDLVNHPELLEKPENAAKASVWFWQNRVQPNVSDFSDTKQATKPINKGLHGLEDRHDKFMAMNQLIAKN